MGTVNVRDLRNHGGEVLDRVGAGETIIVERSGTPVAKLVPLPPVRMSAAELIERHRHLPYVDPDVLRRDIDAVLDPSL